MTTYNNLEKLSYSGGSAENHTMFITLLSWQGLSETESHSMHLTNVRKRPNADLIL